MKKAFFIDKDGTLVTNVPHNVNPEFIVYEKNALKALKIIYDLGYELIVITNQSGIALGYFSESDLKKIQEAIVQEFQNVGCTLAGFFYCPHAPQDKCACRKPKAGLLLQAAKKMKINLSQSWMVGDILNDVEAGNRAGCSTIFYDIGNETEYKKGNFRTPDFTVSDWKEIPCLLNHKKKRSHETVE